MSKHTSADEFKKGLAGGATTDALLVKDFAPEITKDIDGPDSRTVQFVISTAAVDRDGDTIDPKGWDLTSFQKSGAVLWAHDASQLPIAESLACWVEDNKLKARCRFPTKDVYAFASTVYDLIKANVLRCTSVGFKPTKWAESDRQSGFFPGLDFTAQTLLEYSIVSVPANPEAIVEAKRLGIDIGPYLDWAVKTLDTLHESGLLIPRNALEKTYFAAKGTTSVAVPPGIDMTKVTKGGRVLSAQNEELLQKAMDAHKEAGNCMKSLMDAHKEAGNCMKSLMDAHKASAEPDEDDGAAPKAADVVSAKALADAIVTDGVSVDSIRDVVAEMVDSALRRAQGK